MTTEWQTLWTDQLFQFNVVHRDHKDYLGQGAQDGHLNSQTAPELRTQTVQCRFTSTETIRTIWDREPRTAPSTLTLSTVQVQCCFTSTGTIRTITVSGTGGPGQPPRLSHSSWALRYTDCRCRIHTLMRLVAMLEQGETTVFMQRSWTTKLHTETHTKKTHPC